MKCFVLVVAITEFAYLLIINTLLYLPITQDIVNKIRLEKFQVLW